MSPTLDVPNPGTPITPQQLFAFRQILLLPQESLHELIRAFESAPFTLRLDTYISQVAEKTRLEQDIIQAIVDTLATLYWNRTSTDQPVSVLVEVVLRALDQAEPDDELRHRYKDNEFKDRLTTLFGLDRSLNVELKIGRLLYEQEHTLQDMRIITELRPVFRDDPGEIPIGTIALHRMRISYFQDGQTQQFFVTLDSSDITKLRAQLNRAELKERSLKAALERTTLPLLEEKVNG